MAQTQLNNVDAYRFLNFKMVPAMEKTMITNNVKVVKSTTKSDIKDVVFKFRIEDKLITTSPTVYYPGSETIAISLHKMMYSKNISFIKDNVIYIIACDKLLGIWNDATICRVDRRSYQDGLGERAQLSRININWMAEHADYKYNMPDDAASQYNKDIEAII